MYLSLHETHMVFEDAPGQQTLESAVGKLQLDNQNPKANYQVMLAPTPMPPEERQPFIQLSINKAKLKSDVPVPIAVFPYISVLVQKFDVKVEETVVWDVLQFFGNFQSAFLTRTFMVDESGADLRRRVSDALRPPPELRALYFVKLMHLQPIAVNLSFSPNPERRVKAEEQTTYNPVKVCGPVFIASDS